MWCGRLDWNDRYGKPADTDQFVAFIGDPDLPYLGGPADVKGTGGPGHIAFPDSPNVVGVYELSGLQGTARCAPARARLKHADLIFCLTGHHTLPKRDWLQLSVTWRG